MAAAAHGRKAAFPAVTVMLAAAGLALALLPDTAPLLVYDRERVLAGEVWRLATGHAVHFSWTHAAYNLVLFTIVGAWLERGSRARFLWLIALTALASGLFFLAGLPDMARYGGLSGVVSAMVVHLCLNEMRHGGITRALWAAILLLFAVKVGYEILFGAAVFASPGATPFEVAPAAHIIGTVIAAALFFAPRRISEAVGTCRVTRV